MILLEKSTDSLFEKYQINYTRTQSIENVETVDTDGIVYHIKDLYPGATYRIEVRSFCVFLLFVMSHSPGFYMK